MRIQNNEVIKIGKGEFSTAYRVIDSDVVYVMTSHYAGINTNVKEIYTHCQDYKHIPFMQTVDTEVYYRSNAYSLYESRYYERLTAKHTTAWNQARILWQTWEKCLIDYGDYLYTRNGNEYADRYIICANFIDYLRDNNLVPESIIDALNMIYTWATAYGSGFLFEFETRNLKVDHNGDLILLDIVFFRAPKS